MADTLQEFLLSIKYKVDGGSERRFFDSLKNGERVATSLGKVIAGLGLAGAIAYKGTLQYSRSLEQLYFSANRTGTKIRDLRALMIGSESLGASAEGAQASIEGLASFMRRNPMGSASLLKSLGVDAKDLNGKARDTVDIMKDLSAQFQAMGKKGTGVEFLYGDLFGLDENLVLAMKDPSFAANIDKYKAAIGGGIDKAGLSAHNLQNENRLLEARQEGMTSQTMTPIMDELTKTLKLTNKELEDLNGWVARLMNLWNTNTALGNPAGKVAAAAGAVWAGSKLLSKGTAVGAATRGSSLLSRWFPGLALLGYSSGLNEGEDAEIAKLRSLDKRAKAIQKLEKMGFTRAQAIGMVANFSAESSMNHRAVGDGGKAFGLAQWHPHRQADFKRLFGFDIQNSSFENQVEFAGWELKNKFPTVWKKMQEAGADHRLQAQIVSRGYERPKDAEREAAKRAGIAQNIHTTINVTGQKDPDMTARAISNEQIRVNQQIARNTAGVAR